MILKAGRAMVYRASAMDAIAQPDAFPLIIED
jgi:hypothetical protein